MNQKISAIIPTFNEEIHIEEAIKTVSFADEIIVIDSYSSDKTVELIKKHDVRLIQRKFDDFSSQKNFAIEKAKHDWIYILDADERVSEELQREILETLKNPNDFAGFNIFRTFYYLDKKVRFSGWKNDKVIRLFKKSKCKYNGKLVHERIEFEGKIGVLKNKIKHFSYRDKEHYTNKLDQYAKLQSDSLFLKNKKPYIYLLLLKPPARFITQYFWKLGILDGKSGFLLSMMHSKGVYKRYAYLKDLYKQQSK